VGKIASFEGKAVNLHLTLLTNGGQKANVEPSKRVMRGKLPDGCAIRIGEAGPIMGVAEGVETAVSASIMYGIPVWACVNGTLLSKWMPPALANEIVVFGDNDGNFAGQAKAYTLANRLEVIHKRRVTVEIPNILGADWNDIHRYQSFL
jgi:putative DNA primase/helicase